MKIFKKMAIFVLFAGFFLVQSQTVLAYNPTLSINDAGAGNISIIVSNAFQNSSVQLSFTQIGTSLPTTISNFGTTDYSGNFSTTVSANAYGISSGSQVYVTVGGQTSNTITYGYGNGGGYGNSGNITLSPSSLNLTSGQSSNVYISNNNNYYGNNYYISNNSNSSVASATISGNNITVYGNVSGSTTITVCQNGYSSSCGYLYVTVNGSGGGYGSITLSPSSLNLSTGQSSTVYINSNNYNNNYGSYNISSSNSNVATASYSSGNNMTVYGQNSGSATITVCQNGYSSSCGYLYVTVGGGIVGNITFSPSNPSLSVGQSSTVNISAPYIYSGAYYISNNSNSSVVTVSISGSTLNLYGLSSGNSTLTVCQNGYSSSCGYLYVTVNGSSYGNITLSPSSLNLTSGQSSNVYISNNNNYYGNNYYISNNSNSSVASATISGNNITVYGNVSGSTTITVCQNGYSSSCGYLYVTVNGSGGGYGSITLSPSSLNVNVGQSSTVYVNNSSYSYYNNFYISNNSNSSVATANVSGSTITVYGNATGSTTITVCQNGYSSSCGYLYVTVGGSNNGNLNINPSSLNINSGQSATASVSNNYNSYSYNYYISNNSNSSVATASVSGNTIYINGNVSGSTTITVCQNNYTSNCGYLYVTVNGGGNGGGLNFTSTSLPPATIGQYYSVQLLSYGGTPPYTYSIVSGTLPQGLNLNSVGQIFGTPQSSQTANFTVRVTDTFGRTATANFIFNPSGSVSGLTLYNNGALISQNGTVYITYKNMKTPFGNSGAFTGLGFKFNMVSSGDVSGLSDSGFVISTSRNSHPWGSWIKSGNTIYFAHESGLMPIPDWSTFLNNGGQANQIVSANSFDFQRPILSAMVMNDSRLK